jgi:hypothetical protein
MEIKHFQTLPVGASFVIDGESFIKKDEVSVRNAYGIEQMIDPIMDAKLGKALGLVEAAPVAAPTVKLQGTVKGGQLIVTLKSTSTDLFEGSAVTVDGHFDGNVFVVTGIAGSR